MYIYRLYVHTYLYMYIVYIYVYMHICMYVYRSQIARTKIGYANVTHVPVNESRHAHKSVIANI